MTYPTDFGQQVGAKSGLSPEQEAWARRIEGETETTTEETITTELVSMGPTVLDYIDVAAKVVIAASAVAIAAARL